MAHVDYTGCTVLAQIRAFAGADDVLATIPASVDGDGNVVLSATPAQTAAWAGIRGVWDVEVTHPGGSRETILAGSFTPRVDVSRSV